MAETSDSRLTSTKNYGLMLNTERTKDTEDHVVSARPLVAILRYISKGSTDDPAPSPSYRTRANY